MEIRKIIGIISSILLIIKYIGNVIIDLLFIDNVQFVEFNQTIGILIFISSMIGFYYALIKYLKPFEYKTEIKILVSLIVIEFSIFIIKGIQYYYGVIPGFILSIAYISAMILFAIFGIRILKSKNEAFANLNILKIFVISMFIAAGLVFITAALLILNHRIELMNVAYLIYGLPYIFGLLFFLKDKKNEEQPAVNSGS